MQCRSLSVCRQAKGDPTFLVLLKSGRLVARNAVDALFVHDELAIFHAFGANNLVFFFVAAVVVVVVVSAGALIFTLQGTNFGTNIGSGARARARAGSDDGSCNDQGVLFVVTLDVAGVVLSDDRLVDDLNRSTAHRSRVRVDNEGRRRWGSHGGRRRWWGSRSLNINRLGSGSGCDDDLLLNLFPLNFVVVVVAAIIAALLDDALLTALLNNFAGIRAGRRDGNFDLGCTD